MASRSFAPFKHRAYLLMWLGGLVSNIGSWMETTALSYYVADTAKKAAWSGVVAAAGFIPTAILGPVGGALADRYQRRMILVATNTVSAILAAIVAWLVHADHASPPILALLSLLAGCVGAIGFPAWQAALPGLVPAEDLVAAVGLSSTQWNLGRVLGPLAASLAISAGGVTTALLINAGSFFAVVVVLIFVPLAQVLGTPRSIVESVKGGLRYAQETPAVRSMLWLMLGTVLITSPFIGFVSQMGTNVFGGNENTTSILITAQGLGAVAAGASLGSLTERFGLSRVMVGMISLLVPSLIAYGVAPNVSVSAACLAVVGFAYMGSLSSFMSVSQRLAPPEGRGRAMMANNFVLGLFYPLGLLLQGLLADVQGLRWVTVGSGVLLAAVIVAARLLRPQHTRPIQIALG